MTLLLVATLAAAPRPSQAPGFTIVEADSHLVEGIHRVDARIDYRFSSEAIEAMENGVAVTISLLMQVLRQRVLVDETVATVRARYRIQAHSLSQRYVVRNLNTDESKTFQDFDTMVQSLGVLKDFPLLDDQVLEDGETYRARIKAALDIESLPAPMRLLAYFSSSWRLSSDWKSWPLAR